MKETITKQDAAEIFNALREVPVKYMDRAYSDELYSHIISKPTDRIELSEQLIKRLNSIVKNIAGQKPDDPKTIIPADLIFADNIPIKSLEIKSTKAMERVTLFNDEFRHNELQQVINGKKKEAAIGIVSRYVDIDNQPSSLEMFCCIYVEGGRNNLIVKPDIGFRGNKEILKMIYEPDAYSIDMKDATASMSIMRFANTVFWYGINIILQNPVLKECVSMGREAVQDKKPSKKHKSGKQPPKKYIRRIYINPKKMDEHDINTNTHTISKPIWYVTGHWRTYASGKRTFIQGYWKGVARDLKNGETRDRELVFKSDIDG